MRNWAIVVFVGVITSATARAYDVTSAEARSLNLLEYVAARNDLTADERVAWDRAVRLSFGGKALNSGNDDGNGEGVTVAKSVISGAIFFGIPPEQGARAAYQAYHDTYRWVPPPLAINYQLLVFQGRKPSVSAKQLAFSFPEYFNQELAPETVAWWTEMLSNGQLNELERPQIERLLAETRILMRPMLLDALWRGAQVEARQRVVESGPKRREVDRALADLAAELKRSFRGVARDPKVDGPGAYYGRYARLARELGRKVQPRPVITVGTAAPHTPRAKPGRPSAESRRATPAVPRAPLADAASTAAEEKRRRASDRIPAPLPGDLLVDLYAGWEAVLSRSVEGWVGVPYLWGGITKRGVDCSAFVREVYREAFNVELPRNARAQHRTGRAVAAQGQLEPGDLIFFDTLDRGRVTHVGVFLGEGKFAHASSSRGVTPAKLKKKYYQRAYWGSRRLLEF